MLKITGYLNGAYYNSEGNYIQVKKVLYSRFNFISKLKILYLELFYDYVEIEEVNNE